MLVNAILVFISVIFLNIASTAAESSDCLNQFNQVKQCLKSKHENSSDNDHDISGFVEDQIYVCFKDHGCDAPDFESPIFASKSGSGYGKLLEVKEAYEHLPKEMKSCLKDRVRNWALDRVNKCLKEKKVSEITANESLAFGICGIEQQYRNISSEPNFKSTTKGARVILALRKCQITKGKDHSNATLKCLKDVKEKAKEEACKRMESCAKDKVNKDCEKRAKEVVQSVCDCTKQRMKDVLDKLKPFDDGKQHDNSELGKILGDDYDYQASKNKVTMAVNDCATGIHEMLVDPNKIGVVPLVIGLTVSGNDARKFEQVVLEILLNDSEGNLTPDNISLARSIVSDMIENLECSCK